MLRSISGACTHPRSAGRAPRRILILTRGPTGTAIAFTGTIFTELAGAGTARVCLAESGTVTTLTDGPGEQRYPRFSPDGSLLAYLSDAGPGRRLPAADP